MATVGENIKKHRKAQGLSIVGLAEKVGMTEGAIRHYESGIRTPGEEQLEMIAQALGVSHGMLEDHKIESARDLVRALLQLEDEFGLVPDMCDDGLCIDPKATNAQKTDVALKAWGAVRHRLITGEITQEDYEDWKSKF
ncbi:MULTISPECIES: helix-turn-helix domain-containing protein [unclassified Adlercreutzia]|uniref:helix-turn-helix domain-containing protein n=1 Tax=unclassified Adlercreutzia TaxID=2636013 RepID=UPI0013EDC282|nr:MULTISPECIES: helix-turn-helix transcriptional regulator [unclassified Adlercreutzia]